MGLRARIVAVTAESGPRSKNILRGLARSEKQRQQFDAIFQSMIDKGELVIRDSDRRWAKYGPPKQRGAVDLLMIVGLVGALVACAAYFVGEYRGVGRGRAQVQSQWDKKKLEDARVASQQDRARDAALLEIQQLRAAAEQRADTAETKLEEVKREARRRGTALVACQEPRSNPGPHAQPGGVARTPAAEDPGAAGVAGGGGLARAAVFTWQFVFEFDGGWTDRAGQPVSGLTPGADWAERAAAASPYTPEDVLAVAGANAESCSRDRRELASLIARIERAAEAYEQERP
jgi:hypothetical protein